MSATLEWLRMNVNPVSALAIIPMVVMSWHVFEFYESDPLIVRIGLAISFDLLLVVLFYLLGDDAVKRNSQARTATWICIGVLIAFQLYVNVWTYWQVLTPGRALVSGTIFPLIVGAVSWLASLRQTEQNRVAAKKVKPLEAAAPAVDVSVSDWTGVLVTREQVDQIVSKGGSIEQFRKASNWRSVKRWAGGR